MIDPQNGNYRPAPGSPAGDYGCQIFPDRKGNFTARKRYIQDPISIKREVIEVGGTIPQNSIWDADTIKVIDNVQIENNVVVNITPGSIVEFQDFYAINVLGCMQALGEADQKIVFTSANPAEFAIDSTYSGAWNGIIMQEVTATNPTSKFAYCVFQYSKSFNDLHHGGVFHIYNNSKLKITNSIFQNNVADYGGALSIEFHSNPIISGCIFLENYAFISGSPIYCSYSYPQINNNTIVSNFVLNEDTFHQAAAIQTFIAKPKIYNNIIRENQTNFFDPSQLYECKPFYTRYNNISFGYDGIGNIDEDPLFQNSGVDSLALNFNSPCIDSGSPDTTGISIPQFDVIGNQRIYGQYIDMGAYEWQGTGINNYDIPPSCYDLSNYPNPFNPSTTISVRVNAKNTHLYQDYTEQVEKIKIEIFNLKGQKVRTLPISLNDLSTHYAVEPGNENTQLGSGFKHSTGFKITKTWNGRDQNNRPVASGIYFYNLVLNNRSMASRKCLLLK